MNRTTVLLDGGSFLFYNGVVGRKAETGYCPFNRLLILSGGLRVEKRPVSIRKIVCRPFVNGVTDLEVIALVNGERRATTVTNVPKGSVGEVIRSLGRKVALWTDGPGTAVLTTAFSDTYKDK